MKVGINSGKRKNNMKHCIGIISISISVVLLSIGVCAEQYREGRVYHTRLGTPQPALERPTLGTSRDDERIVDENDPSVLKRERASVVDKTLDRTKRVVSKVRVNRDVESEERTERNPGSSELKGPRNTANTSRTSPRRTKVDFIDKDKDGYDDRRDDVRDM
jgi:hypothetical protein